ncbi:MAG: hypothetical protein KIT36_17795 [Alphaproteobacteria bacterium]|nr:hypothetical protein [Alphaproteobacteria bacterium]
MAAVDRLHRFVADHWHPSERARWWEIAAYLLVALLLGVALASAYSFVLPRMMVGF